MTRFIHWDRRSPRPDAAWYAEVPSALPRGTCCLWQAGFIANQRELRARLGLSPGAGGVEILLGLFEREGAAAAERIAGTFAWVLWDEPRCRLVVVRDRLGTQGLYFALRGSSLWVSGDLETLLEQVPGAHRPNPRALVQQIQAEYPPPGETFYEGFSAVEPGAVWTASPSEVGSRIYWRVEPRPVLRLPSDGAYAEVFLSLLQDVVRGYGTAGRMGVTLSSGMDSTSVAAAVKLVDPAADLTALTWTSPELPAAEEHHLASRVAERLNLPQVTVRADLHWPLSDEAGLRTDRAAPFRLFYEELWGATFQELVRQGIGTVWDGMDGDSLFGGNCFVYPDLLLTGRWRQMVRELRYHLPRSPIKPTALHAVRLMIVGPILRALRPASPRWRARPQPWLRNEHREMALLLATPTTATSPMLPGRLKRLHSLRDLSITHVAQRIDYLARTRYNIAMRHPLLDHRMFELAAALPTTQTFRAGQRKTLVRNAMRGILPVEIVDMWGKITPEAIAHRGLAERERDKVRALLTNMRAADLGWVDERCLRRAYEAYVDGTTDDTSFWPCLALEDWLRRWF